MFDTQIIYEDEFLIAVNKPSGLLVHPSWIASRNTPHLTGVLKQYLGHSAYTIHRLDRPTSGVIVFAKNKATAQKLNHLFAERKTQKTYLAVARGFVPEEGTVDYALKEKLDKIADKHANPDKPAQPAVSHFRCLATATVDIAVGRYPSSRYSLVEVKPETGRKHQIRRHLKHISHPIVGDTKHGDLRHNKAFVESFDSQRLLLMATELCFEHPDTGEWLTLSAGVDPKVERLFDELGWSGHFPRYNPDLTALKLPQTIENPDDAGENSPQ